MFQVRQQASVLGACEQLYIRGPVSGDLQVRGGALHVPGRPRPRPHHAQAEAALAARPGRHPQHGLETPHQQPANTRNNNNNYHNHNYNSSHHHHQHEDHCLNTGE